MSVEPELPILGVWPTDAWFVNHRHVNDDASDEEYLELRLMKLRGGNRWVPQVYSGSGEQWFHPGTDDEVEPHMSALSGMLVYPRSLERITRVAGRHGDPVLGPLRGEAVDFLEVGSGKVVVLSRDADGTYLQTACDDDACHDDASARKLPLSGWTFGRRVLRGKHGASALATAEAQTFMLHHDGKSGVWRLDELPPGEAANGMWASAGGGLWTLTGERLRRRDGDGTWHEFALPEGMTGPNVAVDVDRAQLWVSRVVGGAAKIFTTPADPRP